MTTKFKLIFNCLRKIQRSNLYLRIARYVLEFLTAIYVLTAYKDILISWYDDNVMPILEMFVPSPLSFIIMLLLLVLVSIDIRKKANDMFQYSGEVTAVLAIVGGIIMRYRFSGLYYYEEWLFCVTYVDLIVIMLSEYVCAYVYAQIQLYRLSKRSDNSTNSKEHILRDWPIENVDEDILNIHDEAANVAQEMKELDRSKTWSLAITARWGTGKTSFMNLIVNEISKNDFDILYFNPRDCKSYQLIQEDFFNELACLLSKYNNRCSSTMKDYMASLQLIDNRGIVEKLLNFYKIWNKIGFVSPVRRYEALDRCTAAANVI